MSVANITQLPLASDPYFSYSASIEDTSRVFTFKWNTRDSSWHVDITQEDGTPVLSGLALVPNFPIAVDYALQNYRITGYFVLTDKGDFPSNQLNTSPEALAQWYELFYIYITDEE